MNALAIPHFNILTFPLGGASQLLDRVKRMITRGGSDNVLVIGNRAVTVKAKSKVSSASWWLAGGASGCVAAYQPKGAASLAASYVNLANPGTYDAAPGVAPTLSSGWVFNGSTQYLLSNIPAGQKPCTFIARINLTNLTSEHTICGALVDGGMQFRTETTSGNLRFVKQALADIGQSSSGVSASSEVVVAGTYSAAGVYKFYSNGSGIGSSTNDQTLTATTTLIGVSGAGGGVEWFAGTMLALAKYDNVLTDDQIAAVTTAMAAL